MENRNQNAITFYYNGSSLNANDSAKGLFSFLVIETLISFIYTLVYMLGLTQDFWSYVFTLLLDACFVIATIKICQQKRIDVKNNLKISRPVNIKQVLICIAISVVCIFGFSGLTNVFLEYLYQMGYTSVSSSISISNVWEYLMYVVLICAVPAICEETLFRGLICNGFKKYSTTFAVFMSSFLFMIMHGSPDQTVHQFILGIILALAFLITNNLWISIIIHFLNNFIAVTYSFIYELVDSGVATETTEIYWSSYIMYAVVSGAVAAGVIYLLLKALSNVSKVDEVAPVEVKKVSEVYGDDFDNSNSDEFNLNGLSAITTENSEKQPIIDNNKLVGSGKAMLIISIIWLVVDWLNALISGFQAGVM